MSNLGWHVILMGIGVLIFLLVTFKETSDLKGVEKAPLYRFSFFMMLMRGYAFLLFDLLGLFPLE